MLSRRNIRVKILQALYASTIDSKTASKTIEFYKSNIDQSADLLLFFITIMQKICYFTLEDRDIRLNKNLPSEQDLNFKPNLYTNLISQKFLKDLDLERQVGKRKIKEKVDADSIKKLYMNFSKTQSYLTYISIETPIESENVAILLSLMKFLYKEASFTETLEDLFSAWEEDESLVIGNMKKILKQLPGENGVLQGFAPDSDMVIDFGEKLLNACLLNHEAAMEQLKPVLENWDIERISAVDLILIKMATIEFMIFSEIPPSVILNEYVEISKTYSTAKSKDFVNGVLDKIFKNNPRLNVG